MLRVVAVVAGLCFAAFAVWHPVPHRAVTFAPEASARSQPSGKHRRTAAPSDGSIVYVVGAVVRPGLYRVDGTARVNDAVKDAGGFLPSADPAGVNLAQHLSDGDEVIVPRLGEVSTTSRRSRSLHRKRKAARTSSTEAVDLNSADAQTLAAVPGIGASIGARIVELREHDGPFANLDQLLDVAGMTPRRLDLAQSHLYVR